MSEKRVSLSFDDAFDIISEKIKNGGEVSFSPKGISMLPILKPSCDTVTISAACEKPKKGDVVFYRRKDGSFVLHRIIREAGGSFVMCGDNQFRLEKGVDEKQIIGILKRLEHNNKELDFNSLFYKLYVRHLSFRRMCLCLKYFFARCFRAVKRRIGHLGKGRISH